LIFVQHAAAVAAVVLVLLWHRYLITRKSSLTG
jgi:hypothetical protein